MIVADKERILRLRRLRKVFGGGMRQVGILAAAGIYALEHHVTRLREDHQHAQRLAQILAALSNVTCEPTDVETNMILFTVHDDSRSTAQLLDQCRQAGVLLNAVGDRRFRVVTHLDVSAENIEEAGQIFAKVFDSYKSR